MPIVQPSCCFVPDRSSLLAILLLAGAVGCSSSSGGGATDAGPTGGDAAAANSDGSAERDATADASQSQSGADAQVTDAAPGGPVDTGAAAADAEAPREPPPPGPSNPGDGTGSVTFAFSKFFVGDTDPDGTPDMSNGWKNYGFDLDGLSPDVGVTAECMPADNANPMVVHARGPGGLENAFGHLILPIILGISSNSASSLNAALSSGSARPLITLQKLGSGSDYNPLVGDQDQSLTLGSTPKYDGTDVFPVDSTFLLGDPPNVTTPQTAYATAYVSGNTWVSGPLGSTTLQLPLEAESGGHVQWISASIARISMPLGASHQSVAQGMLAGIISTAALQAAIQQVAGSFDPALCSGATISSILAQVAQASDIMIDGTQDPTKTCNGISFGIGFNAAVVQLGAAGSPPPPPPNPCDAGP